MAWICSAGQGGRVQAESRLSATAASLVPLLSKRERAGWVADGYDGGSMEKPYSGGATVGAGARSAEGCACELQEPRHVGSAAGSVTRGAAVGCFVSSGSGTEGVAHEEREAQGPSGSKAPEVKGCAGERPGAGEAYALSVVIGAGADSSSLCSVQSRPLGAESAERHGYGGLPPEFQADPIRADVGASVEEAVSFSTEVMRARTSAERQAITLALREAAFEEPSEREGARPAEANAATEAPCAVVKDGRSERSSGCCHRRRRRCRARRG